MEVAFGRVDGRFDLRVDMSVDSMCPSGWSGLALNLVVDLLRVFDVGEGYYGCYVNCLV